MKSKLRQPNIFTLFFVFLLLVCLLSASLALAQEETGGSGDEPGGAEGEQGDPGANPDEETGADEDEAAGGDPDEGSEDPEDEGAGEDDPLAGSGGDNQENPGLEFRTLEDSETYFFPCVHPGFAYDDSDTVQLGCVSCHAFHQGLTGDLIRPED